VSGLSGVVGWKLIVAVVLASVVGVGLFAPLVAAKIRLDLQPGPFAPGARGEIEFRVANGVLTGEIEARRLPALGAHAFYVLWFVRTDTGDKSFLGPIVSDDSVLFLRAGDGGMRFRAGAFTSGPGAGSAISLGAKGDNLFVVLAENRIDSFMPFPVSPLPSSVALMAPF